MKLLDEVIGSEESFGSMVRAFRECDGLSQATLAKEVGISRQNLCDIERERRGVSLEMAAKFAKVMGYMVEDFVAVAIQDQVKRAGLNLKFHLEAA